jgi:hypothetical protein
MQPSRRSESISKKSAGNGGGPSLDFNALFVGSNEAVIRVSTVQIQRCQIKGDVLIVNVEHVVTS